MTKEQYFEMCEMMNTEPVPEDIPVELEDLPIQVQVAMELYHNLYDNWDTMVGRYNGKDFTILEYLFNLWEIPVEERKTYFLLIKMIDNIRAEEIQKSTPK